MAQHDAVRGHAGHARGLHILFLPLDQGRAAHGARVLHPARQGDRDDQNAERQPFVRVGKQRTADTRDEQRYQDGRKGQHHVAQAHQEGIEPAAAKASEQAQ